MNVSIATLAEETGMNRKWHVKWEEQLRKTKKKLSMKK